MSERIAGFVGVDDEAAGDSDPRVARLLGNVSRTSSAVIAGVGAVVLLGWALDLPVLKSLYPALATMKANTALGFVMSGSSLWMWHAAEGRARMRPASRMLAAAVTLLGALTLLEYGFGVDVGIDQLLFRDVAPGASLPGRMSSATATHFVLIGVGLLALDLPLARSRHRPSAWLALAVGLSSLIALLGYFYGVLHVRSSSRSPTGWSFKAIRVCFGQRSKTCFPTLGSSRAGKRRRGSSSD